MTARYWVPYLLLFATICHYSPLFETVRHYSHYSHYSLFAIRDYSLFALRDYSLFALRDYSLFALRDYSLFAIRDYSLFAIRDYSLFAIRDYSLFALRDYSLFAIRVFQTPSPVAEKLECTLEGQGKSHDHDQDVIAFENKAPFSKCFPSTLRRKPLFSNFSGLESFFEMLRFRAGLVWTVGLTVEIKLRFQIPPA